MHCSKSLKAILCLAVAPILFGQAVLTWHNDNSRTGQDLQETILTPTNVKVATFGKLFVITVDGKVDAQPLYVPALAIPSKGTHNVLFVVTEHDSAYAFDADTGVQLWHVSLLGANESPSDTHGCGQVTPEIGATATPVIDTHSGTHGTIYIVATTKDSSSNYHHRVHALDLTTGAEEFSGPVEVQATSAGSGAENTFNPTVHKERPGLLLLNGVVYTAWGSHCDAPPYAGWVIGYNETTLKQVSVINLEPNGNDGGLWNAGSGPAADSSGNVYVMTGNGTFDTTLTNGFPSKGDYGNAIVKLSTSGSLSVTDYFTMDDTNSESNADTDLGSGGLLLLPPLLDSKGATRSLAVGAGKDKHIYVVDASNMGKFNSGANFIYQDMVNVLPGGVWSSPAWFNGRLYYGDVGGTLKAFVYTNGQFQTTPQSQTSTSFAYPGTTPSISANGTSNAIVWALENTSPAVLHAYDATDLTKELYNSNQAASGRDQFGAGDKFIVPTIANGKVYAATTTGVGVFGLIGQPTVVSVSPDTGSGQAQTFTYTYNDPSGYADINYADALVASNTTGKNACWVAYVRASNALYLVDDSGANLLGPITPGSNTTEQNSQCVLNGTGSSTSGSGNALTVNVNLTFKSGYSGAKNNYGYVQTNGGQTSGWQNVGTWTIGSGAGPTVISVAPSSGTGLSQTFTYTYSDPNGFSDIYYADAMIGTNTAGANACWVAYVRANNALYLMNDAGTSLMGPITPGSNSTLQNSQCTLNGTGSSANGTGNNLTLALNLSFKAAFGGAKNNYGFVANNGGQNSGWQMLGTWNTSTAGAPAVTSVSPSSGSGATQTFTYVYTDPNGYTDIYYADAMINTSTAGANSCWVAYVRANNALYLVDDAGSNLLGPVTPGSSSSAQNSQCMLTGSNSSAIGTGNTLTVVIGLSFKSGFTGVKNNYGYVQNFGGQTSGWVAKGTWTP